MYTNHENIFLQWKKKKKKIRGFLFTFTDIAIVINIWFSSTF